MIENTANKKIISAGDSIIYNLKVLAKEKESVRRKLAVTAAKLARAAKKLAVIAKEKEVVRQKLAITAEKLKKSYETLEQKVQERTKDLEASRAKEEAILLSIGDGLLVMDENGIIIIINNAAEKLLGIKSNDALDKAFSTVIRITNDNGTIILADKHIAITTTPVILDGAVIGTIKIFRDITNEREIDKAKTEFVSLASHQLRTPLSAVNWYAEMLLAGDAGDLNPKQKKYLDEVYRSNQRMVELVNALLDVSSLELGTFVIDPEPTDVRLLAENVIDEQKSEIDIKKMKFSFSHAKNISLMQTDPKLLRMVMQNILSNAIKYTPENGRINLDISLKDEQNIMIKISDSGYGIPKNQQDKIFGKLFRADNVRDKDTDGTGLGLYIVKSIVEKSGGKIWFRSSTEKRTGSTFFVVLPHININK
ncbi:MAG: ATP-binding protein [Patescibacteria group bacterium]